MSGLSQDSATLCVLKPHRRAAPLQHLPQLLTYGRYQVMILGSPLTSAGGKSQLKEVTGSLKEELAAAMDQKFAELQKDSAKMVLTATLNNKQTTTNDSPKSKPPL